jgi:hypothetical protein
MTAMTSDDGDLLKKKAAVPEKGTAAKKVVAQD